MTDDPRDLVGSDLIVKAVHGWNRQSIQGIGKVVAYSIVPQYCIETKLGHKFWWREDLVEVESTEAQTPCVEPEATPEQVTLDDLLPLGYVQKRGDAFSQICTRCGALVWVSEDDERTEAEEIHGQWHAAIEQLTVTMSAEVSADFFDNSPPTITAKGSHMLRIPFTPEQRRELVVALGLDPNRAADCTWPAIMGRVRGGAGATVVHKPFADPTTGIEQCRDKLAAALGGAADTITFDQLCEVVEILGRQEQRLRDDFRGITRGEVDRLRRIEQALIDVGSPNRSERGDPGGLTVAWIKRQTELMAELRAKDEAAKQAMKLLAERPTREAYNIAMEQRALLERKRRECERLHGPLTSVTQAVQFAEDALTRRHLSLLLLAAKGRREYADGAPDDEAQELGFEAELFQTAANLIAQPNRIGLLIPTRMQTAKAMAEVGVDYPVGEVQGDQPEQAEDLKPAAVRDLLLLVGETVPLERVYKWSWKDRQEVTEWACAVHLSASDNDVDVPERPTFLDGPAEAEQVCPSLYLVNDELRACMYDKHSDLMQHGDDAFVWSTNDGHTVPSPWPVDREPPAGINILRDTADGMYLCRETNGWEWWSALENRNDWDGEAHEWATALLDANGDLIVVRP